MNNDPNIDQSRFETNEMGYIVIRSGRPGSGKTDWKAYKAIQEEIDEEDVRKSAFFAGRKKTGTDRQT
ncbi:MAG: hypothetical protein SynsKO_08860 [Synoicihabitans sp.]